MSQPKRSATTYRTLFKVTLRLHDTATRAVREFQPLVPGQAAIYLCGPTVQSVPHIGHLRSAVCFDILIRWLEASGYQVTYCRNVTDIDDKILRAAADEGAPWWAVAERNQRAFTKSYDALGCRPPDVEPRATGHIPEMIALIRKLIDGGHAYPAGGDVYFDVHTAADYGVLSGRHLADMQPAEDTDLRSSKRDPRDFALWKGAKPGEPFWETPWGPGRPGWHLECSAMSTKYLGPVFDIHGGGFDLLFPHHENERAQSNAVGDPFARYWLHNGLVWMAEQKMSKSVGNVLLVTDILSKVRPQELRYYLGQAHYRSMLEYSEDALEEAAAAYQRIERFVTRAQHALGEMANAEQAAPEFPISFAAAMDDDLGGLGRARRRARDSARRQLRSYVGRHRQHRELPGPGPVHARGPRPRPAGRGVGSRRLERPALYGGRRARGTGATAAGSGTRPRRLCFGGLHQEHPGEHRGGGRGHTRRSAMGAETMNGRSER